MDFTIFKENLKLLMKARGFSCKALAEELGISPPAISRYLTGERMPEITYIVKIADYFNVTVDWILGLGDDKFDVLSPEIRSVVNKYSVASADDRQVVQAVLKKYEITK